MRTPRLIALALCWAAPAVAAEQGGCDAFAWDLRAEQRLLGDAKLVTASGSAVTGSQPVAVRLELAPFDSAALPKPPERMPKEPTSRAGFVTVPVSASGIYKVTLSAEAWIDAVQGGQYLKPVAHSGVTGCAGIRKSVKFRLEAAPLTLQLSGARSDSIGVALSPE